MGLPKKKTDDKKNVDGAINAFDKKKKKMTPEMRKKVAEKLKAMKNGSK